MAQDQRSFLEITITTQFIDAKNGVEKVFLF